MVCFNSVSLSRLAVSFLFTYILFTWPQIVSGPEEVGQHSCVTCETMTKLKIAYTYNDNDVIILSRYSLLVGTLRLLSVNHFFVYNSSLFSLEEQWEIFRS